MEKLQAYQGWIGQFHEYRDSIRERFHNWREQNPENPIDLVKKYVTSDVDGDLSHIYRFIVDFKFFTFNFDIIIK